MVSTGKFQKKRAVWLLIFLFCLGLAGFVLLDEAASQTTAWTQRFNGAANDQDEAVAMAVDGQGNIYVTGSTFNSVTGTVDYLIIKYDPTGATLWERTYDGVGHGCDKPNTIALDGQGNIYVTGTTDAYYSGDFLTIKYSPSGEILWAKRFNKAHYDDFATCIAVDSQGNVYVAGASEGYGTGWDFLIMKYDSDSNTLWTRRYDGPAHGHDVVKAMAVDLQGNVYVTGESLGSESTGYDYLTIKYDTNGNPLWVNRYDGPGHGYDSPCAIAVDFEGSVYVTGTAMVSEIDPDSLSETDILNKVEIDFDYATIKYNSNGTQIWCRLYNGSGNGPDEAKAIALNAMGHVFVTGVSYGGETGMDYATVKYECGHGVQLWASRYNGPANGRDEAAAITVDAQGNAYVTGTTEMSEGNSSYATVKYNLTGAQVWDICYSGSGSGGNYPAAIALDSQGNVLVTGSSWGDWTDPSGGTWTTDLDVATIKYIQ
jgi:uncharacterized delta-60 repeat protein